MRSSKEPLKVSKLATAISRSINILFDFRAECLSSMTSARAGRRRGRQAVNVLLLLIISLIQHSNGQARLRNATGIRFLELRVYLVSVLLNFVFVNFFQLTPVFFICFEIYIFLLLY